jgi:hypothetical protein
VSTTTRDMGALVQCLQPSPRSIPLSPSAVSPPPTRRKSRQTVSLNSPEYFTRQQSPSQGESEVRFTTLDTLTTKEATETIVASLRRMITIHGIRDHNPRNHRSRSAEYAPSRPPAPYLTQPYAFAGHRQLHLSMKNGARRDVATGAIHESENGNDIDLVRFH